MVYNKIGKSGLYVSRICLGTMAFGPLCDEQQSFRIMDEALDNGITFFDTANVYAGGKSEEIIGKWFAQGGGRREKVVLITKLMFPAACDKELTAPTAWAACPLGRSVVTWMLL